MSEALPTTGSVVPGSGIGPGLFLVFIADVKASCYASSLITFPDDCTVTARAVSDVSIDLNAVVHASVLSSMK